MPGQQRSQHYAHGAFVCSGGGQAANIHDISNPHHGNSSTMAGSYQYPSLQMGNQPLRLRHYGAPEEGSTAMSEFYSIPELSNHPQYPVPPSGAKRPCPSDFDLPAIGMDELEHSGFSDIQGTSWGATCAPDADVSVRQPQHLSIHNNHPPSSEPPIKKIRRDDGLKGAPNVVGQVGMPDSAPRPQGTRQRFTPEEDKLLIELKENKELTWKQIAEYFPERSSGSVQVRYSTKLKGRSTKNDETDEMVRPNP
ncbi:hypothetical protein ACKLNR_014546 [Fusarium oxysporum f. sp. zingiberi]